MSYVIVIRKCLILTWRHMNASLLWFSPWDFSYHVWERNTGLFIVDFGSLIMYRFHCLHQIGLFISMHFNSFKLEASYKSHRVLLCMHLNSFKLEASYKSHRVLQCMHLNSFKLEASYKSHRASPMYVPYQL